MRKYWIKDLDRCIGCETCVIACKTEHLAIPGVQYRRLLTINREQYPKIPTIRISLSCNHCEEPACLKNCPVNAYRQEAGIVIHDQEKCVGCKLCLWSCPYDAPRFAKEKKKVEKCNLCPQRTRRGLEPACVVACPTEALRLVDDLAEVEVIEGEELFDTVPGFPENQTKAKVRFKSVRRIRPVTETGGKE